MIKEYICENCSSKFHAGKFIAFEEALKNDPILCDRCNSIHSMKIMEVISLDQEKRILDILKENKIPIHFPYRSY